MTSIDKILSLTPPTASELCSSLANRVKQRRLEMKLTQAGLCKRAGINLSSYRRFERTGKLALDSLARLSIVLDRIEEFNSLFETPHYNNLDDVINETSGKKRKRGNDNG